MINHLSAEEHVDLLDGVLAPERAAHATSCPDCRDEAARLRDVAARAALDDVPEPSPLFWEHQAARIAAMVADEVPRSVTRSWAIAAWTTGLAATLATALFVLRPQPVAPVLQVPSAPAGAAAPRAPATDGDERAWSLVEELGGQVDADEAAAAIAPAAGAADRAVDDLDADEQAELVRLLRHALAEGRAGWAG